MKKNILLLTLLTFYFFNGYGQLFILPFTGAATCPTPGSTLSPQPPNVTIGTVTRYGTLTCNATADFYNTANWTTQTTINTTQYIEFTVTAATGYQVNFASLNFIMQRSSTGPVNGRIAHDGGTGTFSSTYDFTATTSNTTVGWDFTDFTAPAASTVKFRIYGWGASGSTGTLRLDDLSLDATVNIIGGNLNWLLAGNTGTNRSSNFIGTTDTQSVALRTNNIERLVIDKNGKVGIGNSLPTALLHTNGSVRLAGLVANDTASRILVSDTLGNLSYRSASSINNGWGITGNAGLSGLNFLGSINNASLRLRTNNIQRIVLDSLGNFGIGVASPTAQLHNNGSVRLAGLALNDTASRILVSDTLGNLSYRSANSINNGWGLTGNAGLTGLNFLGSINNASLRLRTNNIQRIVLDSLGNFGIGVAAPTAQLHNNGSVRLSGLVLNDTASRILVSDTLGNLSYRSSNSINNGWGLSGNTIFSGSSYLGSLNNTSLRIRTNNIERLVIDSIGNVGIGNITPTAQLHANGTIRFEKFKNNISTDSILTTDENGNLKLKFFNTTTSTVDSKWTLKKGNIYSMDMANVGIGVDSATAKFHINGTVRMEQFKNNLGGDSVLTTDASGNLKMVYRPYVPGGGGGGALYNFGNGVEQANGNVSFGGQLEKDVKLDLFNYTFSLNNGLNGVDKVFTVSPDGNTGIGGSSIAGYKLALSGNATIGNKKDEIGDGAKLWFNADGNSSNMWIGRKNVAIGNTEFRINIGKETNTDNRFAVGYENGAGWKPSFIAQANGKAGVGTEDIVSNMSLGTGHGDKVGVGNKLWGSTSIITTGSATSTDYTDLMVPGQNHNNALLRLNSAGNVGIGTFNIDPEYRLSVNGKIRAKGLRVQTDNWADFVFEKNYVLKSLPELEKFIKANKHLPEMPSEAEVIKEGNDVGETQIKLLQKVEELTLYLIDQNKKIDALVEKNKELEKKSKDIEALKKEIQGLKKIECREKKIILYC